METDPNNGAAPDYTSDIPLDVARAAHAGTSHVPEKRAEQERAEYASVLAQDLEALKKHAGTPEKREALEEMFTSYRAGYRKRFLAHLESRARCMSSMITGPSNFPTRTNAKRNATADRRLTDLLEFRKKSLARIEKTLHPERAPIMTGDADAAERLLQKIAAAERLQETMKASNLAIRRNAKRGPEAQVSALVDLGHPEAVARQLLEPDFCGKVGFPSYALTNNNANIRRMRIRLEKIRANKAAEDSVEEGEAATVEDCPADNRVRIRFPGKPAAEIRSRLKSLGFRWAPSTGCWQAYRNHRSLEAAREIAGTIDETEGRKP